MKVIKLVFKKICPVCEVIYRETIFEGAKGYFDQALDSDRFYLPQFECCGSMFYADSYEIFVDGRLVRDGRIYDVFDVESQEDLT